MKIVVINSVYQPDTRGGAEVVVESIVSGLKGRGHDVVVVCVGRQNKVDVISNLICELQDSHGHSFRSLLRDDNSVKVYHIKPFNLFNFLIINHFIFSLKLFNFYLKFFFRNSLLIFFFTSFIYSEDYKKLI